MSPVNAMFEVDIEGLRKLLTGRDKWFMLYELFQNAVDENVTRVDIRLETTDRRGRCYLRVEDDSPEGFVDLAHAWTLFAESKKKGDPTKRGRFNLGEKLVLALCEHARIVTTTGTVVFKDGTREVFPRRKRDAGTVFEATIFMTRPEHEDSCLAMQRLLVPAGVTVTFNGEALVPREPLLSISDISLPTVNVDEEGALRPSRRKTTIELYEKAETETAWLYEMGIPVVETDLPCHANVMQKVPLNTDRDNVTPAYKKELSAHVLNAYAARMSGDEAAASWINQAIEHPDVDHAAVEQVLTKRYGDKRVSYDPSDPEANKLAVSKGYAVVYGSSYSKDAWKNIRGAEALKPAGQVTPSPKPYSDDPNAPVRKGYTGPLTPGMKRVIALTEMLGYRLMGREVRVLLINDFAVRASATYGNGTIEYNVARLGKAWFDRRMETSRDILTLIIHEFGHEYSGDHLSSQYHDALCNLGAKLGILALEDPSAFDIEIEVTA